jgi:hypothetical protein
MPDDQQRRVDRDVPDSEAGKPDDKAKQPKKPDLIRRHPIAFVAAIVVVGRKPGADHGFDLRSWCQDKWSTGFSSLAVRLTA